MRCLILGLEDFLCTKSSSDESTTLLTPDSTKLTRQKITARHQSAEQSSNYLAPIMPQKKSRAKAGAEKSSLHYRLTNEEWLTVVHDLKPSERDLLYHLRTLDPFGDRTLDLTVTSLAADLKVNKSTVSRALKVLDGKGYIDLELLAVRIKLRTHSLKPPALPSNNIVAPEQSMFLQNNQEDPVTTDVVSAQQDRSPNNMRSLNTLLEAMSRLPQTIHTDQTDSLSQKAEREDDNFFFEENGELTPEYRGWLEQRAEQLPTRPTFLEEWIVAQSKKATTQKDFLNYLKALEGKNIAPKNLLREKYGNMSLEDFSSFKLRSCESALRAGDQNFILGTLQSLWESGLQEVCVQICHQLPKCGIEVGENGPEVIRALGEG